MVKKMILFNRKEEKKREGESVYPLKLRGFALLLSLLMLFPFCSPVPVQAAQTSSIETVCLNEVYTDSDFSVYPLERDFNIPLAFSMSSIDYIYGCLMTFGINGDFKKNEVFSFEIDTNLSEAYLFGSVTCYTDSDLVNAEHYGASIDYNTSSFTIPADSKYIQVFLYLDTDTGQSRVHTLLINSLKYSVSSESSGLIGTIIEWLKNIRDKIVNLPASIGEFITNLKDNIVNLFSDLKDNLKQQFDNIGEWFSNLGDNLRTWFENVGNWFFSLGDRIKDFFDTLFNNIKDFFTSLFKPRDDFFDEVKADLDTFLSDHLGFVYQLPVFLYDDLKLVYNVLSSPGATQNIYIPIPEFSFTLKDKKYVLIEAQNFDIFSVLYDMPEETLNILDIVISVAQTLIFLGICICSVRMIYKKIINRVGIEGGDDV